MVIGQRDLNCRGKHGRLAEENMEDLQRDTKIFHLEGAACVLE